MNIVLKKFKTLFLTKFKNKKMFSLIKSKYILAEVFELETIKYRLKLISRNNKIQNRLDINIDTYNSSKIKIYLFITLLILKIFFINIIYFE